LHYRFVTQQRKTGQRNGFNTASFQGLIPSAIFDITCNKRDNPLAEWMKFNRYQHYKTYNLLLFIVIAFWSAWFVSSNSISNEVFLKQNSWLWLYILTFSSLLALGLTLRHFLRGPGFTESSMALFKTFFWTFFLCNLTLWPVPRVWIYLTATREVNDRVEFNVFYPGPSKGKAGNCPVGIGYYDRDLQRYVELCAEKDQIDRKARKLYVQKRVNDYGARIWRYHFIR
jgi:hypothetical protein